MSCRTTIAAAVWTAVLMGVPAVRAAPVAGTPIFTWSSTVSDRTTTYATARDPRDSAVFGGSYLARDVPPGVTVTPAWNNVQEFTRATVTRDAGAAGVATSASVQVSGNAGDFDARVKASAASDGGGSQVLDANAGGRAGVAQWYVVQGVGNQPVSLRVDILFQGRFQATPCVGGDCDAAAFFSHSLGLVSSPVDLTQETPLQINGGASNNASFGFPGTVPDVLFTADGLVHDVNLIVRSNPFAVTTNVPFRLNLSLNASAGSIGDGASSAWIDFFDPMLVTEADFPLLGELSATGFVIDTDGVASTQDVRSLESAGLQLAAANVPEPATLALLAGGGFVWLGVWRRRRGESVRA